MEHGTAPRTTEELKDLARKLGAGEAALIPAAEIKVQDELAGFCGEPRCPSYGLAPCCPPHVSGPDGFRRMLSFYGQALVLKIDVPLEVLLTEERHQAMGLLQEIVARVERAAAAGPFPKARGFAGGSCKRIFCREHASCRVLESGGECRHPDLARPSMSGFGVNVARLMASAGLDYNKALGRENQEQNSVGSLVGLILLG